MRLSPHVKTWSLIGRVSLSLNSVFKVLMKKKSGRKNLFF